MSVSISASTSLVRHVAATRVAGGFIAVACLAASLELSRGGETAGADGSWLFALAWLVGAGLGALLSRSASPSWARVNLLTVTSILVAGIFLSSNDTPLLIDAAAGANALAFASAKYGCWRLGCCRARLRGFATPRHHLLPFVEVLAALSAVALAFAIFPFAHGSGGVLFFVIHGICRLMSFSVQRGLTLRDLGFEITVPMVVSVALVMPHA